MALLQLDNGGPGPAFFGRRDIKFLHVRIFLKQIRNRPFQNSHAVPVDDPDALHLSQRGAVQQLVHLRDGCFSPLAR